MELDCFGPKVVVFEYLQSTNLNEVRVWFERFGYHISTLREGDNLDKISEVEPPLQNLFALCGEES